MQEMNRIISSYFEDPRIHSLIVRHSLSEYQIGEVWMTLSLETKLSLDKYLET